MSDTSRDMFKSHILRACAKLGGTTKLANAIGTTSQFVSRLRSSKASGLHTVTAEMALKIEQVTDGEVTRADLRPDLYGDLTPAADATA